MLARAIAATGLVLLLLAPAASQSLSQKIAAGRAIHKEYQRLKSISTGGANHPMLLLPAFAKKRTEFIPETVGQTIGVFFARFKDGRGFVYFDNFPKLPWESQPSREPEANQMPYGNRAMVLTANTPDFAAHKPTADRIGSMFSQAGYTVTKGFLTVETLLTSKGATTASAMYLHSYGGYAPVVIGDYVIYTSSIASTTAETTHKARLDGQELVYAMADDGSDPATSPLRYGIASNFVTRSIGMKPGSVAFLNCGNLGASSGASMRASFLVSGADLVLYFNGRSGPQAYPNIEYLFDRLLGANLVEVKSPPQRPFSYPVVESRMRELGRFKDPKTLAPITALRATGTNIILLRPIIHWMEVLPNNELWIRGQFGDRRSDSKVTVGGVGKTIVSWAPTLIKVRLTDALTGNSGAVVVHHGLLKSNERPLVQWRGTLRSDLNIHGGNLSHPAQREIVSYTLTLRGDPYQKRDKPDGPTSFTRARFSATNASTADYTVTGYVEEEEGKWIRVWFGSGRFTHTLTTEGAPTGKFYAAGTMGPLGYHRLTIFPCVDKVALFKYQGHEHSANLGLYNISLFDYENPFAHALYWKGFPLDFSLIEAKTKPRYESEGEYHEVKWSAFTATPAYNPKTPL